jgi:hypothetical protein
MSRWKAVVATPDAGEAEGLIQELARRGLSTDSSTGESVVFSFSTDGPNAGDADEMVRDLVRTARRRAGLLEVDLASPRWALEQNVP